MKPICLLFFALFSPASWAVGVHGEVEDLSELALLPTFCKGTQQIRAISNDPKPLAEYQAIYGDTYVHLHHYCWALNTENQLPKIRDEHYRQSQLNSVLTNIEYVAHLAPPDFSLLPEIYISKARILFKLERDVKALAVLFQLTQMRPDYGPAYAQLGDFYQRIGDRRNAIKYFEQGLTNSNRGNAAFFIKKIKELDKNHKIPPLQDIPEAEVSVQHPESLIEGSGVPTTQADQPASSPPVGSAAEQAENPNPYCRFCP
jgi:tetratricopeptide (TPR) repeat protein